MGEKEREGKREKGLRGIEEKKWGDTNLITKGQ